MLERHRDDGRRDRRGEGESDLEAEVDVSGGEDRREEDAQHEAAKREFLRRHAADGTSYPRYGWNQVASALA